VLPSTYWTFDVNDWVRQLDPQSPVSGVLIRDEYKEALQALVQYYMDGTTPVPTETDGMTQEVDNAVPFLNPFSDIPARFVSNQLAAILLGHPGIGKIFHDSEKHPPYIFSGKTLWLYFVLVLRLQAGLPTIFQSKPNQLFFFW
jgi:hypothetical protein